jgi:hypothetical protein
MNCGRRQDLLFVEQSSRMAKQVKPLNLNRKNI